MAKLFGTTILIIMVISINADNKQPAPDNKNLEYLKPVDEVIVMTDLAVLRKSKENRQGKQFLTNGQTEIIRPPQKSTASTSKLVSIDGSSVEPMRRRKRSAIKRLQHRVLAKYFLRSRKV
ncbi:hypothetical protein QAD02_024100 [Eretmocerus hayati]|uniref:Uncharacterized protein n=1 Tax=Eretmocerus hayati TaxID=131215 RepID=A0ACC2Q2L8_9HYME|nr:hypothetical protein QAD02_024100 [Eretmocerus hayati]